MRRKKRRRRQKEVWFLLPSLAGILAFYLLPFGVVIYYSFLKNPIEREYAGGANYAALLQNGAFRTALANTGLFLLAALPLTLLAALLLALLFDRKLYGRSFLRAAVLSPLMVPVASVVLVWRVIFERNGVLNQLLAVFGTAGADWLHSGYGVAVLAVLFLWKNVGYNMVLLLAGLGSIPRESVEIASLEGASAAQLFFRVKLRYLSPALFFAVLMSLIQSFRVFREVYVLTGDYPPDSMYLLQHFMNNTFRTLDYQKMSAAAMVICLLMLVVIGALFALEHWFGKDVE